MRSDPADRDSEKIGKQDGKENEKKGDRSIGGRRAFPSDVRPQRWPRSRRLAPRGRRTEFGKHGPE